MAERTTPRRWLISGGSSGIGAELAREATGAGEAVAIVARGVEVEDLAEELNDQGAGTAVPLRMDLSEPEAAAVAAGRAAESLGGVDVLVNCAALHRGGRIDRLADEDFRSVVELGLIAPYRLAREAIPLMPRGGAIVNIGAVVGLRGFPGDSPYGSAKAGLAGLTRVLAIELARRAITVNLVVPGFTETKMTDGVDASTRESIIGRIPLGRAAQPLEIARVVRWVAETPYMTGAIVPVDGGLLAGFGS